ncbi:MAG: hypothetical protein DME04_03040 [Candidatus Rokuibacteriota bacterium]|nr:MAG: hypothetical protein DME04_03040 [Candidatus Rokubacteria bacterium]
MIRAIPWLLGLIVLACGWPVEAKTYRWINEQGVVTYSDRPPLLRPVEGERDALIAEALELSGTRKALESVPSQIKLQLEARQTALKPPDKARATKILADAFRPEALYGAVRDAFRSSYDPQRMGLVMVQLRSPLFKKVAALELAANEPAAKADFEVFAQTLARDVPAPARVDLVTRQEAVVRSAALQMEMSIIAFKAVLRALEPAVPSEKRPTAREVEFAERTLRSQQDALTRGALVRALYTYRTLSDQELATYVEFSESDAGLWFVASQRKGLLDAMRMAMDSAARQMTTAFPVKR